MNIGTHRSEFIGGGWSMNNVTHRLEFIGGRWNLNNTLIGWSLLEAGGA